MSKAAVFLTLGPAVGISLIALAVAGNSGPGFFIFPLVAAAFLVFLTPLLQLVLSRASRLKNRPGVTFALALGIVILGWFALSGVAVFNQW
jgi:multisubunit Na+/H+ antiporter MnhG subunit